MCETNETHSNTDDAARLAEETRLTIEGLKNHEGLSDAISQRAEANQPVRLACKQGMLIVQEMRDKQISMITASNELEEIFTKLKQRTGNGYEIVQPQVKANG